MKVRCPTECCVRPDCEGDWFPRSRLDLDVSAGSCGLSPSAVRRKLAFTVSSSRELPASSRASATDLPFSLSLEERLPWGSAPSSRHRPAASTSARRPTPGLRSVRGVSHALDGFLRHKPSRVCFTPQPRPGFALQGFVPLRGAAPAFAGRFMPSCRWTRPPLTSLRALDFRALLPAVSAVSSEAV